MTYALLSVLSPVLWSMLLFFRVCFIRCMYKVKQGLKSGRDVPCLSERCVSDSTIQLMNEQNHVENGKSKKETHKSKSSYIYCVTSFEVKTLSTHNDFYLHFFLLLLHYFFLFLLVFFFCWETVSIFIPFEVTNIHVHRPYTHIAMAHFKRTHNFDVMRGERERERKRLSKYTKPHL